MYVVAIIKSGFHHLDVVLGNLRFLGKLLSEEVGHEFQVAVEEPADESQCKHVSALEHRLVVHAAVGQAVFHHLGDGASHYAVGVYAQFAEIVFGLELCLL